jgi:hypothetical protein
MTANSSTPSNTFPHPVLTPILGTPTYASLLTIHAEINANACSIKTHGGGGNLGHLALCIPSATYLAMPGTAAFQIPLHPGDDPVIAISSTAAQITEINRVYTNQMTAYQLYHTAENNLKQCLIAAVPKTSLTALHHITLQYAAVTTLDILAHLDTRYGKFDMAASAANKTKLQEPWNPNSPIDEMWTNIHECRQIAALNKQPHL